MTGHDEQAALAPLPTRRSLRVAQQPARGRGSEPRTADTRRRFRARTGRALRRPLTVAGVMTLVSTLALTFSIPANAVTPLPGMVGGVPRATDVQALALDGAFVADDVARDGYTVKEPQALAPGAYSQTAPTFRNNPSSAIQWPFVVGVPIATYFGPRVPPCAGCSSFHKGLDMNPGNNTPIGAIADGVVTEVSYTDNGGLGVYLMIEHDVNGQRFKSVYAHMKEGSVTVKVGDRVKVGQQIGNVGNTGQSTGPHLHLEVQIGGKPIDAFAWLTEQVAP